MGKSSDVLTGRSHGWGCVNHLAQLPSLGGRLSALALLDISLSLPTMGGREDVVISGEFPVVG